MRKCILCGLEHESGCDKSKWDGVLGTKFNITAPPYVMSEPIVTIEKESLEKEKQAIARSAQAIADRIDREILKDMELQHVAKKRGRPRKNA